MIHEKENHHMPVGPPMHDVRDDDDSKAAMRIERHGDRVWLQGFTGDYDDACEIGDVYGPAINKRTLGDLIGVLQQHYDEMENA